MSKQKIFPALSLTLLIIGFVYGLILPFCWGNNPFEPLGTLSILCENRKIFFWLWTILGGGALFLNINLMYIKYGNANRLVRLLPVIAIIFACGIALTLGHSIADWNPKRVIHWISTGGYVVFLVLSIMVYALFNIKNGKIFRIILIGVLCVFLIFCFMFFVLGKSGMMELIPFALLQILLFIINFCIDKNKVWC